ncbi:TPA: hypothetical protein IWN98_001274 [Enterococcus faecium]|uniref:Lipoprotein, NLP/P60 family n=4 Tax=Enterococcus TaxID=1350 RepID=A0A286Q5M0_ENTAV|nr:MULTISPECIES: bifunctional lytic transglycosylase/C40 family peptidase [Enterococcus]APB62549.1 lipoprotein, NLP/P60 family [Enterococcus avium]APB62443.1 lipoprotein, NLP/P60 family [Enterococcus faecium]EOF89266.1 hypothetical protein SKG_02722 [Enterococcus faecium EnGen0166]EOH41952.1 hypothetical protein SSI_03008 [Enterococcus faecium EnGen0191]EOM17977.1 hypothetical protein SSM_03090 [Enterococcus faecium EnGen0192]
MDEKQNNSLVSSLAKHGIKKLSKKFGIVLKIKILIIIAVTLLTCLTLGGVLIGTLDSFQTTSTRSSGSSAEIIGGNKPLSPEVLKWQKQVEKYAERYGISPLVPYALAIMQVESGGNLPDLMQSSESAGLPVNTLKYEESIDQGLKHLSNVYNIAKSYGMENNFDGICQAYNYGVAYMHYLGKNKKEHTLETAEVYSKNVVAPSLGNTTGQTYSYVNEVSIKYGKTYLYLNGGNFYYAELVKQFIGGSGSGAPANPSEFWKDMKVEMEKYQGWPYVWGGKNPTTGFDCSGLTAYLYQVCAGITIDSYTVSQYNASERVSIKDAKAGDLIFFRGTYGAPDFISHVGIYVNETTMYDSNSSGIGYHNWQDSYWQQHSPEIRRVKK